MPKEEGMTLFHRQAPEPPRFDLGLYEPVVRASICTGERVVCMRERATGKLHELRLIRSDAELDRFCEEYGLEKGSVKTVY